MANMRDFKMKKLCFTLVAIVLSFSIMLTGCGTGPKISIGNGKGSEGDVVEIKLNINNNPGIWGGQIIIDYNYINLSFESVSNGTVFETCEANNTGKCVVLVVTHTISSDSQLKNSTADGIVATLKFKVKTGATKGKYDLIVNSESNFCNANEEMIELTFDSGEIKVLKMSEFSL